MAAVPADVAPDLESARLAAEHIERKISGPSLLKGEELAEIVTKGQRFSPAP